MEPRIVSYCPICTFPFEYCDYGGQPAKCKAWKLEHDLDISKDIDKLNLKSDSELGEKHKTFLEKALRREEIKAEREKKRLESLNIKIKPIRRVGNKIVTVISGLDKFDDIDIKKTSKLCASKFACGCSISKEPPNEDSIIIQGDVCEESKELLIKTFPDILNMNNIIIEKGKR